MNGWFDEKRAPRAGSFQVVEEVDLTSAEDVWALLRKHAGVGWICTTDRVRRVPSEDIGDAPPLSAEVLVTPERTLHLRQIANGWRAWVLEDRLGEGEHLATDDGFLSTEAGARLRYRTWWKLQEEDGIMVWRPFASRFLGWENN